MEKKCANPQCNQTWQVEGPEDEQAEICLACEMQEEKYGTTAEPDPPEETS